MKRVFAAVLFLVLLSGFAIAEYKFDVSVFENNNNYEVEFDDMDDTGTITLAEGGVVFGTADEEGYIYGEMDIRIVESLPPCIRISLLYIGEEWIFTDEVIFKPLDTRYTFEVDVETDYSDGKVYEMATIILTDESIKLLEDIGNNETLSVRYRLSGDRDVDGEILFNAEAAKTLYNDYVAAGGLNNNFYEMRDAFPCEIKG